MKLKWYMKYDKNLNVIKFHWIWVIFQYIKLKYERHIRKKKLFM